MRSLNLANLLEDAPRHLATFREWTAPLSKAAKGIRLSEMFFLYATVADLAPTRILESGRARAQSTLVLSALFPQARIVSLESDPASPDVAHAAERLRDRLNVECRFGDSRLLLPELAQNGDIILIDGPKDFRAVKLALKLLQSGKPAAVFVHDLWRGVPARDFVDRHLPSVFLSDATAWVRSYADLDSARRAPPLADDEPIVYGATLGCFPAGQEDYTASLRQCERAQAADRVRATFGKLWKQQPVDRPPDFSIVL